MDRHASEGTIEILIAEDSSTQAMSLQYLLEEQGYRVTVSENGRAALEAARRRKPTLVISDIVMPELDGYGLCRALKSDPDLADVPVLMVTTLNDPEDVLRGLEAGADSFILKPYDDPFLLNRVQFVLLHRQLRRTERADMGVEISFRGRSHFITSDRLQILNLLLSTYEAAIQRNEELRRSEEELRQANIALSDTNERLHAEIRQRERAEARVRKLSQELLEATEAQLQQSETRFRQLLDVVPAAIYATDRDGRILEYNRAAAQLWGTKPPPQVEEQAFYRDFGLRDADGRNWFDGAGIDLPLRNVELAIGRPDGTQIKVLANTVPLHDRDGEPAGAINCLLDVTELSQAQSELEASRQLAQSTLDALLAHICVLDEAGTVLMVNRAWRAFATASVTRDAWVSEGSNYLEMFRRAHDLGEEQAREFEQGLRTVMTGVQERFSMEYACQTSKEPCWFAVRIARFVFEDTSRFVVAHENITERKLAEEQLRENSALLRIAGDVARIGGWAYLVDEDRLVVANETAAVHDLPPGAALTLDEAIGFYAPEERETFSARFNTCLTQGAPFDVELEFITALGRRIWVRSIGEAVTDEAGRVERVQGALQDITARKQQEASLARTAERLTTTLESITDAFFTVDRQWRFTYVNREAERVLRRERAELLGRSLWEQFPDAVGSDSDRKYHEAMDEKRAVEFETYYAPFGMWFEVHAYPSEEGLAVYFHDVTQRKQAQAALRQSEENLRLAMTAGGLGTWHWNVTAGEVLVSDEVRTMYGIAGDQPMTMEYFNAVLHPDDRAKVDALVQEALAQCGDFNTDFRITRPDGSLRWIASLGRAFCDEEQGLVRMEGVNLDITERKNSEAELIELNERLEQRVDQRTRELEAARQQAEAANEAKSAFLAMMSHEIRTPMNGIVGMVDVLAHSRLSEHQTDAVRTIRDSAFGLLHLIDDILDFSKIEAGRIELERVEVGLADLVESVCESLTPLADAKGVDLSVFVSPRMPEQVWADPTRVRQILYNLVGNAIKFSGGRSDRGRVELRVEVASSEPLQVRVEVIDNGIGMSAETLGHLFEAFRQAEVSTTRRYGGTGLGLAICRRLVRLMDGLIDVESTQGVGSRFRVLLPLEAVPGRPVAAPCDLRGADYVLVPGGTVSAADLSSYLEFAGARTRHIADRREALAACAQPPGAVIVRDEGEGDERAAWLASLAELPQVRHLVLGRGRRRVARVAGPNVVTIDGNSLRRHAFLQAAAVAAGRASPVIGQQRPEEIMDMPAVLPSVAEARARGRLILVAEDDSTNQKVLLRQLDMLGYAAEVANDGLEALNLWDRGGYALVLTDLHMPGLDGYGVARAIRAREADGARTPILALTANAIRGEHSREELADFDEYLTKPLQLAALRAVLDKWMPRENTVHVPVSRSAAPPPADDGPPVLDVDVLGRAVGGDPEVVRELLEDYERSTVQAVAQLDTAWSDSNLEQVGAIAHRMKSSSRAVGALPLGDLCAELENACMAAGRTEVGRILALWRPMVEQVLAGVRQRSGPVQPERRPHGEDAGA
jgi:PAS domain S-box-containing protein